MSDVKEISPEKLAVLGIVGGLLGIYLVYVPRLVQVGRYADYFSVFGALGAICAVIYGSEAVRRISKYGLGTGVPSIGQIAMGMGIVASMFGLAIAEKLHQVVAGPVIALASASVIGLIIGVLAQYVIKMKIPIMVRVMTELSAAGSLIIVSYSSAIAGDISFSAIVDKTFITGFALLIFWVGAVAILHPFNACLGPDEKQKRLLYLAGSTGSSMAALVGIASLVTHPSPGAGLIMFILGAGLWLIFYKLFWDEVYNDAASVVETGLIPKTEG